MSRMRVTKDGEISIREGYSTMQSEVEDLKLYIISKQMSNVGLYVRKLP